MAFSESSGSKARENKDTLYTRRRGRKRNGKTGSEEAGCGFCLYGSGETLGSLEDETFSADGVTIRIQGVSTHPGFAFGKMENAIKIASDIVSALPKEGLSPETTRDREGVPASRSPGSSAGSAVIDLIVRDFEKKKG